MPIVNYLLVLIYWKINIIYEIDFIVVFVVIVIDGVIAMCLCLCLIIINEDADD